MSTTAFVLVIFSAALHAYWNFIAKKLARNPAVFFMGLSFALALRETSIAIGAGCSHHWAQRRIDRADRLLY